MSTTRARSSSACSASLQAKLAPRTMGREQRRKWAVKKTMTETVPCVTTRPLPASICLRRRGAVRSTACSFPPRNRGRTATFPKKKSYDQELCSGIQTKPHIILKEGITKLGNSRVPLTNCDGATETLFPAGSGRTCLVPTRNFHSVKNSFWFVSYNLRHSVHTLQ